ncbi:MAG: hypothetical protein WC547_07575 [Candidatus Omnitrophota bacterium]
MEQSIERQSKGLRVLIFFYALVLVQNILGWRQFGGSALVVSVISGTIVYMTVGLIRRQARSWFIAVAFHIAYQLMMTLSVIALHDPKTLQELYKMFPAESVPVAEKMIIVAFCLLTIANASAVIYLFKNKKHFSSAGK